MSMIGIQSQARIAWLNLATFFEEFDLELSFESG